MERTNYTIKVLLPKTDPRNYDLISYIYETIADNYSDSTFWMYNFYFCEHDEDRSYFEFGVTGLNEEEAEFYTQTIKDYMSSLSEELEDGEAFEIKVYILWDEITYEEESE